MIIKWGIISVANIARAVIPAIQKSSNGSVVAISSRDLEKARTCAQEFEIPKYYGSYLELLEDPEITAVYIPLPNQMHKEWVFEAAKHHKHILCEKPFALTEQEAEGMFSICKNEGVKIMEGFMYRFDPKIEQIKKIFQEKALGDIKYIDFNFSHPLEEQLEKTNNYRLEKEAGGGAVYDLGVYGINLCNYLLDSSPKDVIKSILKKRDQNDIDRTAIFQLKYDNDIIVTITVSFQFLSNYLNVAGTIGNMAVSNIISQKEGNITIKKLGLEEAYLEKTPPYNSYIPMIRHFNECIIENKAPMVTEEQTKMTLQVVEIVLQNKN